MKAEQLLENIKQDEIYSFKPFITSKDAKPKYMQSASNLHNLFAKNYVSLETSECSFHPMINKKSKLTESKSTSKVDPYTRLYRKVNKTPMIRETPKSLQRIYSEKPSEFQLRQNEYESRKQEKIENAKLLKSNTKPSINAKSIKIMNKRGTNKNQVKSTNKINNEDKECTFKPKILPISKKLSTKTYEEMSTKPKILKEKKTEILMKELLKKEAEKYTFYPEMDIGMHQEIESKLKLKYDLKTYIKRIDQDRKNRQSCCKVYQNLKDLKEIEECT